ncbi:MAG: hypothetical protein PF480_15060 [Roseovarius sp.]|jgi:hypothetical protein|nr:hypothetical protein [Roseovarius sp.]
MIKILSEVRAHVHGTLHWMDRLGCDQLIHRADGWHRIRLPVLGNQEDPREMDAEASGVGEDWDWEYDPVDLPGQTTGYGADYVSWTRCTPYHLMHWLMTDHTIEEEGAWCPWRRAEIATATREQPPIVSLPEGASDISEEYWASDDDLPSILVCDELSGAAFCVEDCLYNSLLPASLNARAMRIREALEHVEADMAIRCRTKKDALLANWADTADGSGKEVRG